MLQIMSKHFLFWNMDDLEAVNVWQQLVLSGILELAVACREARLRNQTFSIEFRLARDNHCWRAFDEWKGVYVWNVKDHFWVRRAANRWNAATTRGRKTHLQLETPIYVTFHLTTFSKAHVWSGQMCPLVTRKTPPPKNLTASVSVVEIYLLFCRCGIVSLVWLKPLMQHRSFSQREPTFFYPEPACDARLCTHTLAKKNGNSCFWEMLLM